MAEVPEGTIEQVLEWVGDDPDRAAQAYEAEVVGKGRKTLLEALAEAGESEEVESPEPAEDADEDDGEPADHSEAARRSRREGKEYAANKRLRYRGKWYEPGDVIPGASQWPRVESWIRQGYIREVQ